MTDKYCSGCKTHKDVSEFQNSSYTKDGKTSRCSACLNKYRRDNGYNKSSARKPQGYKAEVRSRYFQTVHGRAQTLYHSAAVRAKKKGMQFELDVDWIKERLAPLTCEVTGLPLVLEINKDVWIGRFSPTLERVDNTIGYTKENTMIVCAIYNQAKADGSHEDVLTLARALMNKEKVSSVSQF